MRLLTQWRLWRDCAASRDVFDEALSLHSRALAIREQRLGPAAPATLESRQGLAALYGQQGQWEKAERLLRQVLQQRRLQLGPRQPETLLVLNNLGMVLERQSRWHEAEALYRQAQQGFAEAWGSTDLAATLASENLARLLMLRGETQQAEMLQRRSLASRERLLGATSPRLAIALGNLAETLTLEGRQAEATPLLERGLRLLEQGAGAQHPETITLRQNLGVNRWLQGRIPEALALLAAAQDAETLQLQREVPLLPRSERASLLASVGDAWLAALSLAVEHPTNEAAVALAWRARLNRHGLLQSLERHQALLAQQVGGGRLLVQQLAALQTQLADLGLDAVKRQALVVQQQALERRLYRSLPQLKPRLVGPNEVAAALPPGGVLVELQRYARFDPRQRPASRWGEAHLLALVLPSRVSGQPPFLLDLGLADPLEQAIAAAKAATLRGKIEAEHAWTVVGSQLWEPLRHRLQGFDRVSLTLDGDLHQIPFGVLQRTVPRGQLQLLTTGRDLLPESPGAAPGAPLVLADPDFGVAAVVPEGSGRGSLRGLGPWSRLPATLNEGRRIAADLGAVLIHGAAATAPRLAAVRHPLVLHVATHGYFMPEPPRRPGAAAALGLRARGWADPALDPLLRSGLVLARARDDGYLTAAEVSAMDLGGTRLVTLSACDTGRGVRRTGEAVYGLQRALRVAGTKATLLSLWKVDDRATQVWMERFYDLARQGVPLAEALHQVQTLFRTDPTLRSRGWAHPFYWAAWQLVGADGPLFGEDATQRRPTP